MKALIIAETLLKAPQALDLPSGTAMKQFKENTFIISITYHLLCWERIRWNDTKALEKSRITLFLIRKLRISLPSKPSPLLSLHKCFVSCTERTRKPTTVAHDQRENESHIVPPICTWLQIEKALKDAAAGRKVLNPCFHSHFQCLNYNIWAIYLLKERATLA